MLSVIVCTYNREKYIYNLLRSLAENTFSIQDFEIVLINNNSSDDTEKECFRFQSDFPTYSLRYFIEKKQGLSYARNRGIRESKGDILIYVDDDATVNTEYLSTYAMFFKENKKAMAAGGAILPVYETERPGWLSHYTEALISGKLYLGDRVVEFKRGKCPGGGNAAYRKEVFDKVGLFNEDLGRSGGNLIGAEEKDIFDKMRSQNLAFFYLPDAVLYHIIPEKKLTDKYFNNLTSSIGKSEYVRTRSISPQKYYKRLIAEIVKWVVTILLCIVFFFMLNPKKGLSLLRFRWNVTKGLLNLPQ